MAPLRIETSRRHLLAVLCCGLLCSATGCATTPQAKLHGRWFNSEMSIRFRTDGTVIFNSIAGLATGRYFFNGEARPDASSESVSNLTMDLQRNGDVFRVNYELQFLGHDRLRIQPVESLDRGLPSDAITPVVVLKRFEEEDVNGLASAD